MRLAGRIKLGFYPTPISVVDRIRSFISVPEKLQVSVLDPCCGEGLAVKHLVDGWESETYGIELDGHRAEEAKQNLSHVLKCSNTQTRITNGCFSILFLNPPYDEETFNDGTVASSERKEMLCICHFHRQERYYTEAQGNPRKREDKGRNPSFYSQARDARGMGQIQG